MGLRLVLKGFEATGGHPLLLLGNEMGVGKRQRGHLQNTGVAQPRAPEPSGHAELVKRSGDHFRGSARREIRADAEPVYHRARVGGAIS